ncbi:MAG TPA: hypothetical protein PK668_20830 [Myxococcota bacterium]|nr:hypothetical protein [Myxococcota bacterium]HRY96643.1 hypothetical protein [Myxococcota bacterium]
MTPTTPLSDEALLAAIREFFSKHPPDLRSPVADVVMEAARVYLLRKSRILYGRNLGPASCEDLAGSCLLSFTMRLSGGEALRVSTLAAFYDYLNRTLRNRFTDHLRRKGTSEAYRQEARLDLEQSARDAMLCEGPHLELARKELVARCMECVKATNPRLHEVLRLALDHPEALVAERAALLGMSEDNYNTHFYRAKKAFKDCYEGLLSEEVRTRRPCPAGEGGDRP